MTVGAQVEPAGPVTRKGVLPPTVQLKGSVPAGHVPPIAIYIDMRKALRLSPQTAQVLAAFLQTPKAWRYGYDLSRGTELKSGTLYPILMRLADHKLLETCWEPAEPGTPPRHMYRLTPDGLRSAREHLRAYASRIPQRAALGGVKA